MPFIYIPPISLINRRHNIIPSRRDDVYEEQREKQNLKREVTENINKLNEQTAVLIKKVDYHLAILDLQLETLKKIETIKYEEITRIEEKIENDEDVSYETIELSLKALETIQDLKRFIITRIKSYKTENDSVIKIVEEIKKVKFNLKQLEAKNNLKSSELAEISLYITDKNKEVKNLEIAMIGDELYKDYILNDRFIMIRDTNINSQKLHLSLSIGGIGCDNCAFIKTLKKLEEFIALTGIKKFHHISFPSCDFSSYSVETKKEFESFMSSIDIIEILNLNQKELTDEDLSFFSKCSFNSSLKELYLCYNNLETLDFLKGTYSGLEVLDVKYNNISDISGIEYVPNLKVLSTIGNNITDISSLSKVPGLTEVNLGADDDNIKKCLEKNYKKYSIKKNKL